MSKDDAREPTSELPEDGESAEADINAADAKAVEKAGDDEGDEAKAVAKTKSKKSKKDKKDKGSIFARFALFLRQVVAELRKVIWPTRSELINYTVVVVIFVVVMAAILSVYDFAFARAVFWVFGA